MSESESETVWRWTFSVWPLPFDHRKADNILMAMMKVRLEAYYTEEDFLTARHQMIEYGWILNDVEKWPIANPQFVAMLTEEYEALNGVTPTGADLEPECEWQHHEYHPSQF